VTDDRRRYAGTLTEEDLARVSAVREHWMRVGLSTERCDRPKAEAAIAAAYRAAGVDPPQLAVWMDSPLGGAFATGLLRNGQLGGQLGDQLRDQLGDQLRDQLGGQLWGQLGGQLWGQLGGQLWGQLGDQLWGQLGDQLWGQLGGQLGDQLGGQLGDQLRDQLGGQLRDQLGDQLRDQLGGQLWGQLDLGLSPWYDAYWLGIYTCALPAAPIAASERLDALALAVAEAGWWWPMRGAVVITDRPAVIRRDDQARLHAEDGPALAWADGHTLHAWHGLRVPQDLVVGDGWDTERILREENTEVRRAAIERRGWDRFVAEAGMRLVSSAPDPANHPHTLDLYDIPRQVYGEPVRVVLMTNASPDRDGTRRRYGETVPAEIADPVSAQAWAWDIPRDEYALMERAT
jgi:hypothetical protein